MAHIGTEIGTVVGNTSPQEFTFYLKSLSAKLGDLVNVEVTIPGNSQNEKCTTVLVWGRITSLSRFNPFLPAEAGLELAEEGRDILDTVLSSSRDQIEATVIVLGYTSTTDYTHLIPLNYPVQPGAIVRLPPSTTVQAILIGDDKETHRLHIGTLIGRNDVDVGIKTNVVVARHMAILAMTGGGKTVAARRIIRELFQAGYPMVILDPHGDYLGFWERKGLFDRGEIKLYYPHINVNEQNRDVISYLVANMTQGFSDPQRSEFENALEGIALNDSKHISTFIDEIINNLGEGTTTTKRTVSAVKRGLRLVKKQMDAMETSNQLLRDRLADFPFEAMPDPLTEPNKFVRPGQISILYLGGYDHMTQSTIVSLVLRHLFEARSSMKNTIPPFMAIVEEAHNFIPSKGEGQMETPSVEIIRKVITEGRKFGVGLLLISQRPSRLDETTLSQCNTFLVFRLVNPRDQSFVEKVMENLSQADSRLLSGFGPGQGIISGQAVRFPLIIQVKFDPELVSSAIGDEDFLKAAMDWNRSKEGEMTQRSDRMERRLNDS